MLGIAGVRELDDQWRRQATAANTKSQYGALAAK